MNPFEIRNRDKVLLKEEYDKKEKNEIYLVLDNLRSAFNVGSIIRTADTLRIKQILLCGTTPDVTNEKIKKTSMEADEFVDTKYFKSTELAIKYLKEQSIDIYALETTSVSKNLYSMNIHKNPSAFIFGNEAMGISEHILMQVKEIIEVPVFGFKNSLNVSNTTGIVLFEIMRQWGNLT